uniref:Uncharacterized protein n=1 Tax=Pseudictyota dubia TaxID=2749911 RepID=A0A7R9VVL9_9STRA|mmetsp:Transcript_24467/g.45224  ORF Transcript_24467/g.45224 Transcript_24467/m.45224 type:complete len:281 (+) Transcript_24467:236-1078(+)
MTVKKQPIKTETNAWDNRTRVAVYGQAFLLLVAWSMALGRLICERFWNAKRNEEELKALIADEETPKVMVHFIKTNALSYFTTRFVVFFPHVVGAILWWNLYFLQLIPSVRQKYRRFHRILGRVLMVCALAQTISGVGLAYMGNSSTVKIISYLLAISVTYCVYHAWYFVAIEKDIPKHKYWSMRLVGYLQTIAFQRVVMVILIVSHRTGWLDLYPPYNEDDGAIMEKIFDDSFAGCFPVAVMLTEWYLAGYYGWTEMSKDGKGNAKGVEATTKTEAKIH